jgi:hypothetical protein
MIIGFTGSRKGITLMQKQFVAQILKENQATHVNHGDCVGADESFHEISHNLQLSISVFPPDKSSLRAHCSPEGEGVLHPEEGFLKRNHRIVDSSDILIACPESSKEQLRSGTWSTVRYARKKGKRVLLVPAVYDIGKIKTS